MIKKRSLRRTLRALQAFLEQERPEPESGEANAVSLFSGVGISDAGYEIAGFRFRVQVEKDPARATLGRRNFPRSRWIVDDVVASHRKVVRAYQRGTEARLDLLVATPPCQGMSSSNPTRGKRRTAKAKRHEDKNALILGIVPIASALRPRAIVCENVRQIRTHAVRHGGQEVRLLDVLAKHLPAYSLFETSVNMADYGIPQVRHRALLVFVHKEEPWLAGLREKARLPWPRGHHAQGPGPGELPWISVRQWFDWMKYPPLSSKSPEEARDTHRLHVVPHYESDRFTMVSHIPPHTGRSAYENDVCPRCRNAPVPFGLAVCPNCGEPLRNRPIVFEERGARLIRGFKSSYRRMRSDASAPTIMTNSSHIGSDNKIHPWEDRVLSILECADLQTVPRFFDWSAAFEAKRPFMIRSVIGESFPSYFTYLHGRVLRALLGGDEDVFDRLADAN